MRILQNVTKSLLLLHRCNITFHIWVFNILNIMILYNCYIRLLCYWMYRSYCEIWKISFEVDWIWYEQNLSQFQHIKLYKYSSKYFKFIFKLRFSLIICTIECDFNLTVLEIHNSRLILLKVKDSNRYFPGADDLD